MTFTHLNSANRSQRNAGTVRRVMSALLTSALLIVGALAMSGSASAAPQGNMQNLLPNMTDQPRPVALHIKPVDFALGPGFCIFGTHHGKDQVAEVGVSMTVTNVLSDAFPPPMALVLDLASGRTSTGTHSATNRSVLPLLALEHWEFKALGAPDRP
jgi:hypothetical protein